MIAELKNDNFEQARRESALHVTNSSKVQKGTPSWEIKIGIPGSTRTYESRGLYSRKSYFGDTTSCVEKCCLFDRALLCTIYTAVHHLCKHPISQGSPLNPKPQKDFKVEPYCDRFQVFINEDEQKVFILFDDKSQVERPNNNC